MHTSRRMACLLLVANAAAWAQTPATTDPAQLPPSPSEQLPVPGQNLPPQLPHQGNLPNVPSSSSSSRVASLPTATIREFRSNVSEITPRGATDMFIVALVKTRKFRVLERARLAEGAAAEKALNQQGMTTGQAGQSQYVAATYMFEATVSEASVADRKSSFTLGLAGAAAGTGSISDSIAIDVRVTDVESGIVVEAVTVRRELKTVETKVAGVTSALASFFTKGRGGAIAEALTPNDLYENTRKDSLDRSLREAIEEAVAEIAKRLNNP
jgi:curli biogenesis system outer membrane secretion channel CsgG